MDKRALGAPHSLDLKGSDFVTRVPSLFIRDAVHTNTPAAGNQRVAC